MPITELLAHNAKQYGDEVCLVEVNPELTEKREVTWREYELIETNPFVHSRREITWRQFDEAANRFANLLSTRHIGTGDKVAILLMNCLEWLPIYFGVLKTGAVAVPMNYRYTAEEIDYCLKLSEADALVFGPEFIGRIEAIADRMPRVGPRFFVGADCPTFAESYNQLISYCSSRPPKVTVADEDDAAVYFSSGTTGFPKAILHDHASLLSSCLTEQNHHGQTRDDCFLCIPPLYHTGAKMHWFGSLLAGSKAVLLRGVRPEWIMQAVSDEGCTIVWLLVPWAQDLHAIDSGDIKPEDYALDQWRLMHIGAQPVPPSLVQRWLQHFPAHLYDTNYGLSESVGPGCVHLGTENIHKVGAIGRAGYLWQTKIVDEAGADVVAGQVGELAVKGPGVMKSYYNDPEATAAVLKEDGWLLTGDMAREDDDGFIYLVDRKKDVIITGGENIYPVQIEDFLHQHPAIKDVAVIGLPDERLGEISAAVIQLKTGREATEQEILDFCSSLPRYKRPRKVIFAKVPRNATGKIEKPKLRDKYAGGSVVEIETKR